MAATLPPELIQKFSRLELEFAQLWEELHPSIDLVAQYPISKYRADFCHPVAKVVIECQGGTWVAGMGHSSGKGIKRDCQKICTLTAMGYAVFPLTCDMIAVYWLDAIAKTIRERC